MSEFERLLDGCQRREPGAFAALVERYLPLVRAVVRRQLSARLRTRFDSQDFTQNVWASFFQVTLDRLVVPTEGDLIAYLAKMAECKVAEEGRDQHTLKRDIRRDRSLTDAAEPSGGGNTPSQEVMARDRWEALTAGLSEREREMLSMLRDGHSHEAVAARFDLTTKTVRRLVEKLRHRPRPEGQ
jgi:RNA polymerase sigma-70 factor (ECF subfamily)